MAFCWRAIDVYTGLKYIYPFCTEQLIFIRKIQLNTVYGEKMYTLFKSKQDLFIEKANIYTLFMKKVNVYILFIDSIQILLHFIYIYIYIFSFREQ